MKNLLCIFAIAIASNSFAQDTTKAILRSKTITMISYNQRFTENPQLQEVQSKCDSVQMAKSCLPSYGKCKNCQMNIMA